MLIKLIKVRYYLDDINRGTTHGAMPRSLIRFV